MTKPHYAIATWQRIIIAVLVIMVGFIAWSLTDSLIRMQTTNRVVRDYVTQTQSMTAQFSHAASPYTLTDIQHSTCIQPTVMDFVAHEDDDLLFMSPALLHDIQAGNCVRTVYFTAGDGGRDTTYWLSRQQGAEQAYNTMLGAANEPWQERIVMLPAGQIATIASPNAHANISLIFLHLPDGGLRGNGFTKTLHQSLQKLYTGQIASLSTVDKLSSYTTDQLTKTLTSLMQTFQPTIVRSLSSSFNPHTKDHSDHTNVARYTTMAYKAYQAQLTKQAPVPTITYYLGYPIRDLPENLTQADITAKTKAFVAYGAYDDAMCHKITLCYTHAIYGSYLGRQYTSPY